MRYTIALIVSFLFLNVAAEAQWEVVSHIPALSTQGVQTFATDGHLLFAGTSALGILRSSDSGRAWDTTLNGVGIVSLLCDNGDLYAGTSRNGLLRSHDLGATWPDTLRRNAEIKYIVRLGKNLVYSVFGGGIVLSSDNGQSWGTVLDAGFSAVIATNGRDAYANANKSIYHSSDDGLTWQQMSAIPGGVYDLAIIGNRLFLAAGSAPNMITSADSGKTWTPSSNGFPNNPLLYIHRYAVVGSTLIAGTNQGAYVTTDLGANWKSMSSGIVDQYLWPVVPALGYVFSGDTQIIRIPVSKIPKGSNAVSIVQIESSLAAYPNPVSSDLSIDYAIPSAGLVTITILDISGRAISSERENASEGNHTYHWSRPDGLQAGMYECLLSSGGRTKSLKFVVE
jgi:photosystem II stability/assembly factor-like uncharacterized protein